MGFRKAAMSVITAASILAVPSMAVAQTASAAKLSVSAASSKGRVGASSKDKNDLGGGGIVIAIIAAAAVVAGIVIAADGDDSPDSP